MLKTPLKTSLLPPLGTLGVGLATRTPHPLTPYLWSQWPLPSPAQLPHRLVHLVDGTLLLGLNPSCKEAGQTRALGPRGERALSAVRLEGESREQVTTISNGSKGKERGRAEWFCLFL